MLVTYKCAASHDLEPMDSIYVKILKKRVCMSQINHELHRVKGPCEMTKIRTEINEIDEKNRKDW